MIAKKIALLGSHSALAGFPRCSKWRWRLCQSQHPDICWVALRSTQPTSNALHPRENRYIFWCVSLRHNTTPVATMEGTSATYVYFTQSNMSPIYSNPCRSCENARCPDPRQLPRSRGSNFSRMI
jgi:hypothetical protein